MNERCCCRCKLFRVFGPNARRWHRHRRRAGRCRSCSALFDGWQSCTWDASTPDSATCWDLQRPGPTRTFCLSDSPAPWPVLRKHHSFKSLTPSFVLIVILRYSCLLLSYYQLYFTHNSFVRFYPLTSVACKQLLNYKYQHTNKYSK